MFSSSADIRLSASSRRAGVPIGNYGNPSGGLVQSLAHLAGEVAQSTHQGIFFKNDAAVFVGIDLQGVALADSHRAADLLGDHDTA